MINYTTVNEVWLTAGMVGEWWGLKPVMVVAFIVGMVECNGDNGVVVVIL